MDEKILKYNNLAVASFVATILGIIGGQIKSLASISAILMLVGIMCAVFSYIQIKRTNEKGKGLVITVFIVFLLMFIAMILMYLPIF